MAFHIVIFHVAVHHPVYRATGAFSSTAKKGVQYRKPKRSALCRGKVAGLFDFGNHLHPHLVAPALIAGAQPLVHNHFGGLDADHPRAKRNDVGVVVLL